MRKIKTAFPDPRIANPPKRSSRGYTLSKALQYALFITYSHVNVNLPFPGPIGAVSDKKGRCDHPHRPGGVFYENW